MLSMNQQQRTRARRGLSATLFSLLAFACASAHAQSTTQPAPVVASSSTVLGTGLNQPQGVGVDASGDVFAAVANSGSVVEYPASGAGSTTIITGLSYNKGLAVDSFGNVYSTSYGGNVTKWTAAGGTSAVFTTGSSCPDFAAMGYYIGFYDLTADGHGNIFAYGGNNYLLEFDQSGNCTERLTPTVLSALSPNTFASDSAGDIYFNSGNNIYYVAVGSNTPVPVAVSPTAFSSINALSVDAAGNLYVTDSNSIDEIPYKNGALNPAGLTYLVPANAAFSIGISSAGVLYYGGFNAGDVNKTVIGSLTLGASNVGTAGTAGTLTYTFNAAVTPTSFTYVSGNASTTAFATAATGTTCATGTAYVPSTPGTLSTCTLNVTLTPTVPGRTTGAVLLQTAGATLATSYLSGAGTGPALTVDPGTQVSLGTFTTPSAVRVDGAGNIFVADSSTGTVTEFASGSTTGTVVASGLNHPQGLAVDGAGDLFIADTGNNQIVEVPVVNGALNTAGKTAVASGLSTPLGLATDLNGDLLIANSGAGNVLEVANEGGVVGTEPVFAVGSGFSKPTAVAVDAAGNLFVGDATLGNVFEITPAGAKSNVLAGYTAIAGLAVDANDDLFLTQTGIAAVTRIALVSGAYASNNTTTIGTGLKGPQGIAVDNNGNVYIADAQGGVAYEVMRTAGSINFGKVNTGNTSASQNLSLSNAGNAALTLNSPLYTLAGNTGDFTVGAGTQACGASLARGTSCSLSASFSPTAAGTRTATLTFSSNAANAASITATLSGTGANSAPTTLTLSASPSGSINFGQPVTVTAKVSPANSSTFSPTGSVQFIVDGSNYGSPVTLSGTDTASVTLNGLAGGSHTVDATYGGDSNFATSAAASPLSITIATAPTTTSLTATINGNTAVATGTSVTFTATVQPTGLTPPPYPSGTVTFYAAGSSTALGTASLTNGVASFTTSALPNGQYNVTAVYGGDVDFSSSTSAGYAVFVSPPTFVFSNLPTALTVPAHGSNSTTFTVTNIAGYQGTVYFSCTGLPANAACGFTPGAVDFFITPGAQTVKLTVTTGVPAAGFAGIALIPGFVLLLGMASSLRRKSPRPAVALILFASAALAVCGFAGCGNSSSATTPTGSSQLVVHALGSPATVGTSQTINQMFTINLQVQ
jgi:sugar lactone lactonase YvrE